MKRFSVVSSTMVSVGYSASRQTLEIEFAGGDIYQYLNVSPDVYTQFISASSLGRYFNIHIKPYYEVLKLS